MFERFRPLVVLVLGLAASGLTFTPPVTITVVGQDDASVDRAAIQAALDAAAPGDTVELVGVFQLDGQRIFIDTSRLTLAGRAIDDDGDGAVNEDWPDGADNDADGLTDEDGWDAVLRGVAEPDGSPALDDDFDFFNRGVTVEGVVGRISHVTVRDIEFADLNRALSFSPDFGAASFRCADFDETGGKASHITVEGNRFDNVVRGAQAFGSVHEFVFAGNVFGELFQPAGISAVGALTAGGTTACNLPDGSLSFTIEQGTPSNGRISENLFETAAGLPLGVIRSASIASVNNLFALKPGALVGPLLASGEKNSVAHNRVTGGIFGMLFQGESPQTGIDNNVLRDAAFAGILFNPGASRYSATNNDIEAGSVDIFLNAGTSRNRIVSTDFVTSVVDQGERNKLVGTLAMVHNPGVPDDVRAKLEDLRDRLATLTQ